MAPQFTRGKYRAEDRVIGPSLTAIENAYDVLLALPEQDCARFHRVEAHKKAAESGDAKQASQMLLFDAFNQVKFLFYTSAFKARQLTAALVHAYNSDNFLAWLILGRSSLEYAAVSYHFARALSKPELRGPIFAASHLMRMDDHFLKYAHGTRFNWVDLFAGNGEGLAKTFVPPDSSRAVNVMTALKTLAKRDDRYQDVEIVYEMLSDFAHPNMASHAAVLDMSSGSSEMHECQIAAVPSAQRGEFLMVVTLPWVSMGIGTTVELLTEVTPLLETWLKYIDGGESVTVDFTK
jgi:hypothetical protein